MSAPKIKIYLLDPGYSEEADNDVQFLANDELVPFTDKSKLLEDVVDLTAVTPVQDKPLTPIRYDDGTTTEALVETSPGSGYYQPQTTAWPTRPSVDEGTGNLTVNAGAAWWLTGVLGVTVYDDQAQPIDPAEYELSELGVQFAETYTLPPSMTIEFYHVEDNAGDRTQWALDGDTPYEGNNASFNRVLVAIDDASPAPVTPTTVTISTTDYKPLITLGSAASKVIGTYVYLQTVSRHWIAEQNNWVGGHYNLNPDVFVGETDYPGDQTTDEQGTPFEPGFQPKFRHPDTYQASFRDGMVTFPEAIDPASENAEVPNIGGSPVKALFAYLTGVENVDGMRLTYQGVIDGRHAFEQQAPLAGTTRLPSLNEGDGVDLSGLSITDRSGASFTVDLSAAATVQDVIDAVASAASGAGRDLTLAVSGEALELTDNNGGSTSNLIVGENGGISAADLGLDKSVAANTLSGDQVNWPEATYPDARGKRLIGRDNQYNPRNVYNNGVLAPVISTLAAPDPLTVKN